MGAFDYFWKKTAKGYERVIKDASVESRGLLDQAVGECREGLKINPDDSENHYRLSLVLDEAINQYKKIIAVDPANENVFFKFAFAFSESQEGSDDSKTIAEDNIVLFKLFLNHHGG